MSGRNYKQVYAIKANREKRIKENCRGIQNRSGIYVFWRNDESGLKMAYCGQAKKLLERCAAHLGEFDHIALSLKKRCFYNPDNPYGWQLWFEECSVEELDEAERRTILTLSTKGYQLYNKTAGGQGAGKVKINEYRPSKGYRDGLQQGRINASREISHLFEKHLTVGYKSETPNRYQLAAMEKFKEFLNLHKGGGEVG